MDELQPDQRPDFCVHVKFKKGVSRPERVFRSAAAFVESLQRLDALMAGSIDSEIKPVLLLEEVEAGSVKIWLKQFLEAIDDDALKSFDWKPMVGKYLVQAKHKVIKHIDEAEGLGEKEGLTELSLDLHALAKETDARRMPTYSPVSPSDLAHAMQGISESLAELDETDSISIESDEGTASITPPISITKEDIANVLTGTSITNEAERILMVRRPDFLGDSMWEFRHQKKSFSSRILDEDWLADFRAGNQVITPGNALRAKVLETITYGTDGEVLEESSVIVKVLGIIREISPPLPTS